ncbi:MAG: hypothetical protein V3U41_10605 [candidate division NC10 bacterium]
MALNGVFLLLLIGVVIRWSRPKVQQWIGGAIGRFMQNLANQAAEEEGSATSPGHAGALELGGFKIDVGTIKELLGVLPEIMKAIKMFQGVGLLGGGGAGGSTFKP